MNTWRFFPKTFYFTTDFPNRVTLYSRQNETTVKFLSWEYSGLLYKYTYMPLN